MAHEFLSRSPNVTEKVQLSVFGVATVHRFHQESVFGVHDLCAP
jgi:serine/threonine protein kinase HipA of HipAB toxin-antitoxin module